MNLRYFVEVMDRPSLASMRLAAVNCSGARPLRKNAQAIAGKVKPDVFICTLAGPRPRSYPRKARGVSTYAVWTSYSFRDSARPQL